MTSRSVFSCCFFNAHCLRDAIKLLNVAIEARIGLASFLDASPTCKAKFSILYETKNPTGRGLDIKKRDDTKGSNGIVREVFGDTCGRLEADNGLRVMNCLKGHQRQGIQPGTQETEHLIQGRQPSISETAFRITAISLSSER